MTNEIKVPKGYDLEDVVDIDCNMFDEQPADEENVEVTFNDK